MTRPNKCLPRGSKSPIQTAQFFSETAEAFSGAYDTDPDFSERQALWRKLITGVDLREGTALDIGCGPGVLTAELIGKGYRVTAVDGSQEMLERCASLVQARRNSNTTLVQDFLPDLTKLGSRKFQLIICSSVLEYVSDLPTSLSRICSLLEPGGTALISIPNKMSVYRRWETLRFALTGKPAYRAYVEHLMSLRDFRAETERAGLEALQTHYYGRGNRLAAKISSLLPDALAMNLYVCVLTRKTPANEVIHSG